MGILSFSIPEEEETLLVTKAYRGSYFVVWFKILIAGLILFFLFTLAWPFWWDGHWGRVGAIIFLVAAIFYALFDFWKRFLTTYIVTRCRIIDITQEKLFRRTITEISLEEIKESVVKQRSWWNKITNSGDVVIKLQGGQGVLVFHEVKDPNGVKKILDETIKETSDIIDKEGKECSVVLKDDQAHSVPLSYSYYGDRKLKKNGNGLIVVEKKKSIKSKKEKK